MVYELSTGFEPFFMSSVHNSGVDSSVAMPDQHEVQLRAEITIISWKHCMQDRCIGRYCCGHQVAQSADGCTRVSAADNTPFSQPLPFSSPPACLAAKVKWEDCWDPRTPDEFHLMG